MDWTEQIRAAIESNEEEKISQLISNDAGLLRVAAQYCHGYGIDCSAEEIIETVVDHAIIPMLHAGRLHSDSAKGDTARAIKDEVRQLKRYPQFSQLICCIRSPKRRLNEALGLVMESSLFQEVAEAKASAKGLSLPASTILAESLRRHLWPKAEKGKVVFGKEILAVFGAIKDTVNELLREEIRRTARQVPTDPLNGTANEVADNQTPLYELRRDERDRRVVEIAEKVLDPLDFKILILRIFEGLDYMDISRQLDGKITAGNARVIFHRALVELKLYFQENHNESSFFFQMRDFF